MNIIGVNGSGWSDKTYILTATKEEIANLMGYHYASEKAVEAALETKGAVIPISAMYGRLYDIANAEKHLMEISAKLKTAADMVDTALPAIRHINKSQEDKT